MIPLIPPSPLRHHHYPSFFAPSQLSSSGQNDAVGDPITVIPPLYRCLHVLPFLYLLPIPLHLSLPPNQNPNRNSHILSPSTASSRSRFSASSFAHNTHIALALAPCAAFLLDLGGAPVVATLTLGLMITYILDSLNFKPGAFFGVWASLIAAQVAFFFSSSLILTFNSIPLDPHFQFDSSWFARHAPLCTNEFFNRRLGFASVQMGRLSCSRLNDCYSLAFLLLLLRFSRGLQPLLSVCNMLRIKKKSGRTLAKHG